MLAAPLIGCPRKEILRLLLSEFGSKDRQVDEEALDHGKLVRELMIPVKIQRVGLRIRGGIEIGLLDLHGETGGNKAVLFVVPSGAYGSERRGPDLLLPAPHPPRADHGRVVGQSEIVIELNTNTAAKK